MCSGLNLKNLTSRLESLHPSVNVVKILCLHFFVSFIFTAIQRNKLLVIVVRFIGWFFFFYTHVLRAPRCHTASLGVMTPPQWIECMQPEYNHYHEAHCLHSIVVQRKTLNCSKSKVLAWHSDIYMLLCSQCPCVCVCAHVWQNSRLVCVNTFFSTRHVCMCM